MIAVTMIALVARVESIGVRVTKMKRCVENIEVVHEHPDDYKFGTTDTNKLLSQMMECCKSNCRESSRVFTAVDRLAQLIAWDIEKRTGRKPPPPSAPALEQKR
jgi:hypothetical protein